MTYSIPENISEGLHGPVVAVSQQVSIFGIGVLFLIFLAIYGAGVSSQKRGVGRGYSKMWLAISSFITTVLGLILFLTTESIINLESMIMMMTLCILFVLMYLISEKD